MKSLSRSILAAFVCALSGCVTFSLEYTTPKGTTISGSTDGSAVTLGASRPRVIGARGETKSEAFGASTSFQLPKQLPPRGGLAK
jgi:hypothetical protein